MERRNYFEEGKKRVERGEGKKIGKSLAFLCIHALRDGFTLLG